MASFSVPCPKCPPPSSSSLLGLKASKLSFQSGLMCLKQFHSFGSLSSESATFGIRCLNRKQISGGKLQAKLNEAATVENSNSAPVLNGPSVVTSSKEEENHNGALSNGTAAADDESSISAFMAQVADLVKLVDSRDIVELQLKQSGCEVTIRKTEALEPPPVPASPQYPYPTYHAPPPAPPAPAAPAAAPASSPPSKAVPALPSPAKALASFHPPMKCPMAGTFYRSPAPGEPAFVKVGDKVQKGQVICIIEAMKLMNEIEADQSGTIVEIIAEDGKPVSVDTPLFVIVP
ncbi:unnamed protein product [Lupinus luteus]|uniref:Biotin carboxyl carrier protein of acetyl-CoA carboxylase n=1 Tax=Lupinus luteus TaxID=3873 RepID=A0AAV1XKM3_LUPLU